MSAHADFTRARCRRDPASWWSLVTLIALDRLNIWMFRVIPKGYFPQDDTGLIFAFTEASPDVPGDGTLPAGGVRYRRSRSRRRQCRLVHRRHEFRVGQSGPVVRRLKPGKASGPVEPRRHQRLRGKLARVPGISVFMFPVQDIRAGGRQSKSQFQFTLGSLARGIVGMDAKIVERLRKVPLLADVTTDREQGGPARQCHHRPRRGGAARRRSRTSRHGAQRRHSANARMAIVYTQRNQYRVIVESNERGSAIRPTCPASRLAIEDRATAAPRPTSRRRRATRCHCRPVARVERSAMPLAVNHQGSFPATTISFNLAPKRRSTRRRERSRRRSRHESAGRVRTEFAGEARLPAEFEQFR